MFHLIRRALTNGVVTTAYPDEPDPAPEAYRGQVTIDPARCVGTGDCARVCPSQAIRVLHDEHGGWLWELDDARCVFCGLCQDVCPVNAIQLSNEYELATRHASHLVTRVIFRLKDGGERA
ncbi:MAG TPA: 4Fe-4S dicluster domain-containing protein [Thermomicrobiales bacterium]|nr:4Fe-4S dicluster domain-containing protein [Thermomicrobiales bacterium]